MPARLSTAIAADNLPVELDGGTDLKGLHAFAGNPERTYTRLDRIILVFIIHTVYYSEAVRYCQSTTYLFITGSPINSQGFFQPPIELAARLRNNMGPLSSLKQKDKKSQQPVKTDKNPPPPSIRKTRQHSIFIR
jgi:hypothetical protein